MHIYDAIHPLPPAKPIRVGKYDGLLIIDHDHVDRVLAAHPRRDRNILQFTNTILKESQA